MKKVLAVIVFSCIFFTPVFIYAQQLKIDWQTSIGGSSADISYKIIQTKDGGYLVGAYTLSNDGDVSGNHGGGTNDYWIIKLNNSGIVEWKKLFGGSSEEYLYSLLQAADGGYILTGLSKSNDGDVTGHHGGLTTYDCWIVKVDSIGNLQWQKSLGGSGDDYGNSLIQTNDGGYVLAGSSKSNDGDVSGNHGVNTHDYWIVKLNSSGTILWSHLYGGSFDDLPNCIIQTKDGGYAILGNSFSDDGDVTGHHGSTSSNDYWILKLDSNGGTQWQKSLGGTVYDYGKSLVESSYGGYFIAGLSTSNDGDVTGNHGDYDYWVLKLNEAGNTIEWSNSYGGSYFEFLSSCIQVQDGGYLLCGHTGSNDGDINGNKGGDDVWIVKLDKKGNFVWQKTMGGTTHDHALSIIQNFNSDYVLAGSSRSNNGDVTVNKGAEDCWIVQFSELDNQIAGQLFYDYNKNQTNDSNEIGISYHKITEANSGAFVYSRANGTYSLFVSDSGNYSVKPASIDYFTPVPTSQSAYFSGINQTDSLNDFAFQSSGSINDLKITITPTSPFRPGRNASYMIIYSNMGETVLSGSVTFFPFSNVNFVSSNPSPDTIYSDSLIWNFSNLRPFTSDTIIVFIHVSPSAVVGTVSNSSARIDPVVGDATPPTNFTSYEVQIVASYDPNDILVDKDTVFTYELISPPFLDYIIRFQNTGNDTAFNIKIFDNIPINLDESSFEYVASSDPVSVSYTPKTRLLQFHFDNILLPDSNVSEPESHGFVRYQIKPLSTLTAGDTISSRTSIYFDFNQPVLTNTASTKIVYLSEPTGIKDQSSNSNVLVIYPNPSTDKITIIGYWLSGKEARVEIYNMMGERIENGKWRMENEKWEMDVSGIAEGIYIVQLNTGNKAYRGRFVKQ